ncbi:outer membrane beta-barrel protein [Flavobacterium sp. GNP001]
MKKISFIIILVFCVSSSFAQYRYRDANRIGISVGTNYFNLLTSDFETNPELGWNAGLSMRGNFYNNWDLVYAMQFSEQKFSVTSSNLEPISYKLPNAELSLLASFKVVENHLSFEFGPAVQMNGKLGLNASDENKIIKGTTLLAKDLKSISNINVYPVVGVTFGLRHFRANISYQYGLLNTLSNIKNTSAATQIKGNASILNGNFIIYL